MLREVSLFLAAVFSHWQAYLTGGAPTAILVVLREVFEVSLPRKFYVWLFLGGFLPLAVFLAWDDEHTARTHADAELAGVSNLIFAGKVEFVAFGRVEVPQEYSHDPTVTVIASLTNTGASSIARDYKLVIVAADGRGIETWPLNPPSSGAVVLTLLPKQQQITLCRDDALDVRTHADPISNGGGRQGYLSFQFSGGGGRELVGFLSLLKANSAKVFFFFFISHSI